MTVTLHSTEKIVELKTPSGIVPARLWEGTTESGIACHAFITRIAVHKDLDSTQFDRELHEKHATLSPALQGVYDARLLVTSPFDSGTIGAKQFAYNGRKLVLRDQVGLVLFVWMFPDPTLRMDGQTGYNNAIFRNESTRRSSEIILEAEALAVEKWGPNRAYTYIDPREVASVNPGYCFKCAGWTRIGYAKDGKHLLEKQLL